MKIFIKTLETKYELDVQPDNTIAHLKYQIQDSLNIKYEQQRLIYNGLTMTNEYQIIDYGVKENGIIHLLLSMS
jgi:hypothetical protein